MLVASTDCKAEVGVVSCIPLAQGNTATSADILPGGCTRLGMQFAMNQLQTMMAFHDLGLL